MPRAARTCSTCPAIVTTGTRCPDCRRAADKQRRPDGNPYGAEHRNIFREGVLRRDPICVLCRTRWSTVADHYPLSRRELVDSGANPNDPRHGRGLCKPCHDSHTAHAQPGGWATRGG